MRTAYLMALIDKRRVPPSVSSVSIFSDNEKSLTIDHTRFAVARDLVPSIPPRLRPDDLSKYVILWEAEWTAKAPIDPLLLSKVNDTLYAVVAQWDLTPLEQRVLEGRL